MNQNTGQPTTASQDQGRMTGQQVLEIVRNATAETPDKTWVTGARKVSMTIYIAVIPVAILTVLILAGRYIPGFSDFAQPYLEPLGYLLLACVPLALIGLVVISVCSFKVLGNNKKMRARLIERSNQIRPREGLLPGQEGMQGMTFGALDALLAIVPDQACPIELLFACSPELRIGGGVNVVLPEHTDPTLPMIPEGENCMVELRGSRTAGEPLTAESLRKCLNMFSSQYGTDTTVELRAFDENGAFCLTIGSLWDIYPLDEATYVIAGFVAEEYEALATFMQADKNIGRGVMNWIKQERKAIAG